MTDTALTINDEVRGSIVKFGIRNLAFKINDEVGFKVEDYDLDDSDLDKIISRAKAVAQYGIYGDENRLSASDQALIDLAAGSIIYVTAAMGQEALLKLADQVYRSGEFFLVPGSPVLAASASGPTVALLPNGKQLELDEDKAKAAWDFWVDSLCVIIKKQNHEVTSSQIGSIKTDLKHRWYDLVTPLLDNPVQVKAQVTKRDIDTYLVNGQEVPTELVSEDIQRAFRGQPAGTTIDFEETIDPEYVVDNSSMIRELGSFVRNLDTKTEDGRKAFEKAVTNYALLNVHGVRDYLRGSKDNNEDKQPAYIRTVQEVIVETGEIIKKRQLIIDLDTPANERWVGRQLSARYEISDEPLVA